MDEDQRSYAIGYGRPPIASRFQKGTSGNPKGRPKSPARTDALEQELKKKVIIIENGKRKHITKETAFARRLVNRGLSGEKHEERLLLSEMSRRWKLASEEPKASPCEHCREIQQLTPEERKRRLHELIQKTLVRRPPTSGDPNDSSHR